MTAVVVLGAPRSGTSAVAGTLARLGLPYAVDPSHNPPTYEDRALRGVDPATRVAGIVTREAKWGPDPWIHKDPVAIDTFRDWWPRLAGHADLAVRWVVVFRDPWATAMSEAHRTSVDVWRALTTARRRVNALVDAAVALPHQNTLVLSYEKVLAQPEVASARLARHVGVPNRPGAAAFVRPGYRDLT